MSRLVSALQSNDAFTANGAVTHSTSDSRLLDFFSIAGAMRNQSDYDILLAWEKAYLENSELALRMLLWLRDVRGGAGERRTFRVIYNQLNAEDRRRIMLRIPDVGRWDDIWGGSEKNKRIQKVLNKSELSFIAESLDNGLLCKWLPRKGVVFDALASHLNITAQELRRRIVARTKVVEQQMSAKQWSEIRYESVPSKAMSVYNKAFGRRDCARFSNYLNDVVSGKTKINASTLFPYDVLLNHAKTGDINTSVAVAQWAALPNYYSGEENILVVADVSGSMGSWTSRTLLPIHASISLAMYCSERNNGIFKDCFITFSAHPKLQKLTGNFSQRINQLSKADWSGSTNLQAVFDLILRKAVDNKLTNDDMPTKIIIVSDMEFDSACTTTNYSAIQLKYSQAGYKMPSVVFWNVNGRSGNSPVKMKDANTALVSGYSPSIIPSILGNISPYEVMMKTIMKDRYTC